MRSSDVERLAHAFANGYLSDIINDRDKVRRRASIERLTHPDICHVSFDRTVYGQGAFEQRIDELLLPLDPTATASLVGTPQVDSATVFFRWKLADDARLLSVGNAFAVLDDNRAVWFYATVTNPTG